MSVLVQKYGGSSVADVEKIGKVADRVVAAKKAGNDVVVVVSAMGKTTDGLIALARQAAGSDAEPPRRELDMLVSTGERVTMALLAVAIHARGSDAISFTGSQSGILTNDRHFDARIIEVRPHRIQDELSRGRVVIVAGYQGMSYKREITTLGRGGSDTTAVALAAALGAERCEIYSDVDGVYSADPRVVPETQHLPELDLAMLAEMAESGAKVLNAQAVEWARRNKVTIVARKTSDPDGARETIARGEHDENRNVRAIVGATNVVHASLRASDLNRFLEVAARLELPIGDVVTSGDDATVHLPLLNVPDWQRCARELEKAVTVKLTADQAIVSVVGYGLGASLAQVLATVGVAPLAVTAGPLRISLTLKADQREAAERALHAAFIA